MTRYMYNRGVAVKEGYRSSAIIDKGCFKRPVTKWYKGAINSNSQKYMKEREKTLDFITRLKKEGHRVNDPRYDEEGFMRTIFGYFNFGNYPDTNNNSRHAKQIDKIYCHKISISLKELTEVLNVKKRGIHCYVEKQNGLIYTLRDLSSWDKDEVYEIKLDKFYDIVGKAIYANITKVNGNYKVNILLLRKNGVILKN